MEDIVEAARTVLAGLEDFIRECGMIRECDLADASLRLEARITEPGSPEESIEAVTEAALLLAPTIEGKDLANILRWLEERATVKFVAGRGVEVALGLESPNIRRSLQVLEKVALDLARHLGPGLLLELYATLDEDGLPVWSLTIELCDDADYGLEGAAEHGVYATLKILEALRVGPEILRQETINPASDATTLLEEPREICAGISIRISRQL